MTETAKNLTTHVALVLDRSGSMDPLKNKTIQVADDLIAFLAEQSKAKNQEWRVSVYSFGSDVTCHIWNMDVLRLPSMRKHYRIDGMTALVDATFTALEDADKITEHRGDHAFLTYVITDGHENASRGIKPNRVLYGRVSIEELAVQMCERIDGLKDNRTLAILVPNERGAGEARKLGFQNILLWDTTEDGMERASQDIRASTTTYMEARTQGAAGLRSMKGGLFVGANVDAKAVKAANLTPLASNARKITVVVKTDDSFEKVVKPANTRRKVAEMGWFVKIEDWVKRVNKGEYPLGDAFYQLVKTERVQGDKEIAVVEVNTNKVYVGDGARQLLGLPDHVVSVKPNMNPDYKIFIQSNSVNRHLPHGSEVMVLKR